MDETITETIKRFLLGTADPKEQAFVKKSLQDKDFADEYWITEDDLVSDYLSENLTPQEQKLFESYYLTSDAHKEKLALKGLILSSLKEMPLVKKGPVYQTEKVSMQEGIFHWISKPLLTVFSVILFGLMVFAAVAYLDQKLKIRALEASLEQTKKKLESEQARSNSNIRFIEPVAESQETPANDEKEVIASPEQKPKQQNPQSKELQTNLEKDKNDKTKLNKTARETARLTYPVFTLKPLAGQMSNGAEIKPIFIPKKAKEITFIFTLPPDTEDYKGYKTDIAGMIPENGIDRNKKKVTIKISPKNLGTGKITIALSGITDSGEEREFAIYQINVKR
jgi:hypothetical protein